ncbi:hypothetical protein [Sulfurovum sp.]|uniref:hypothetical protein n=1 Tax=Sulfurovum sp. TaxID=1969726 RepID=UPI0025FBCBDE|nr:hypothetical protein [Sulfurovum sp.]
MLKLKQIKTTDLAKATGMSLRNLRRYESGELHFDFIKGADYDQKLKDLFYHAKIGVLIQTILRSNMFGDKAKSSKKELQRLAEIGKGYSHSIKKEVLNRAVK